MKVGSTCKVATDCNNRNCVKGKCTRKNAKKSKAVVKKASIKKASVKKASIKKESVKNKLTNGKIGSTCQVPTDCNNRNCIDNKCTRKNAKKPKASVKKASVKKTKSKTLKVNSVSKKSPVLIIKSPPKHYQGEHFLVPNTIDLLKMETDLKEVGISKGSFYFDPCYFLNNFKKLINKPELIKYKGKEYELLPIIYPKNKAYREKEYITGTMKSMQKFKNQMKNSYLSKDINLSVCFDSKCFLGEGSFGSVYKSKINDRNIVIKEPKHVGSEENNEVFEENMVQSELFCGLRGNWASGARIPKIEFMARLYMPNKNMKIVTGIEPLDGDLFNLVRRKMSSMTHNEINKILKSLLVQISELLVKLQDKYDFHHRDLHGGNIMYKKIGDTYRWYIIDFGMSYMKVGDKKYHTDYVGPYGRFTENNFSYDLRMLFPYVSTFCSRSSPSYVQFFRAVTDNLYMNYQKKGIRMRENKWHTTYDTINYKMDSDQITNPRKLLEILRNS